jgi:Cu+-exporting ATPase
MRADRIGRDTMLARIVRMVAEAQRSRAPIQRLADRVAGWFVPVVIGIAIFAFAAWGIWGPEPRFAHGLVAAVAVLIIAAPVRWAWRRRCRSWWASGAARRPES